jgi:hypothetical protein
LTILNGESSGTPTRHVVETSVSIIDIDSVSNLTRSKIRLEVGYSRRSIVKWISKRLIDESKVPVLSSPKSSSSKRLYR